MMNRQILLLITLISITACRPSGNLVTKSFYLENPEIETKDSTIALKYASIIDAPSDSINNLSLYSFVDDWMGTPYLLGGADRSGLDCSFFVQKLYVEVYDGLVARTAQSIFESQNVYLFKSKQHLKEGDLLFFKLSRDKNITHIGVYLQNGHFVHSTARKGKSGKSGVKISDINDPYWDSIYHAAGKVKF